MPARESTVYSVLTTVGDEAQARRLAGAAVERRLAACAQVERIESHYRWDGALHAEPEWRLVFKTSAGALDGLLAWLRGAHPYELPQLLWQAWDASPGYAAWVRAETCGSANGEPRGAG
jgi:periplasmic divalent cation tolerance protein